MSNTLLREKAGDDLEMYILPEERLAHGNFVQKFKYGNIVVVGGFLKYRKFLDEKPQDIISLPKYNNYQLTCVAYNLYDLSQAVLKVKSHVLVLHSSLDDLSQKVAEHFEKLKDVNIMGVSLTNQYYTTCIHIEALKMEKSQNNILGL